MKKLLSVLLLAALLLCALTSCSKGEPTVEVNADGYLVVNGVKTEHRVHTADTIEVNADGYLVVNGVKTEHRVATGDSNTIQYPLSSIATTIESLPLARQEAIDAYVADCKMIQTVNYMQDALSSPDLIKKPYISFTNTFVYDFSKVDESALSPMNAQLFDAIKALNGGKSAPLMYIELYGLLNYYGDSYMPIPFNGSGILYGYFIFEDETVKLYRYDRICINFYHFEFPEGTEFIDCGNKYAEEADMEACLALYQKLQSGALLPDDILKRLRPVEN